MKPGGGFEQILKSTSFTDRVISMNFDEGHCISAWGGFRPEYREVGRLRYLLPKGISIVITSATLPELVFDDVLKILERSRNQQSTIELLGPQVSSSRLETG